MTNKLNLKKKKQDKNSGNATNGGFSPQKPQITALLTFAYYSMSE